MPNFCWSNWILIVKLYRTMQFPFLRTSSCTRCVIVEFLCANRERRGWFLTVIVIYRRDPPLTNTPVVPPHIFHICRQFFRALIIPVRGGIRSGVIRLLFANEIKKKERKRKASRRGEVGGRRGGRWTGEKNGGRRKTKNKKKKKQKNERVDAEGICSGVD